LMVLRKSVTVRCTMTHPVPRMLDLIRFFEDFGFSRIVLGRAINPLYPSPVDCTEADFLESDRQEREELIPWMLRKLAAGEKPKYFPYAQFITSQDEGTVTPMVSPFKCGACRGTTTVGADGTLYPCHRFVGMQDWRIGHLSSGPDIERCKRFWRDYRASVAKSCEACWLWAQCRGPCPWEIARNDGSFGEPTRHCNTMQDYAAKAAYVYFKKQTRKRAFSSVRIPMKADTCSNPYRTPFRACRTVVGAERRSGGVIKGCPTGVKVLAAFWRSFGAPRRGDDSSVNVEWSSRRLLGRAVSGGNGLSKPSSRSRRSPRVTDSPARPNRRAWG
jgi:radical SAM protein with 4Fe4S-binding SPASM domain